MSSLTKRIPNVLSSLRILGMPALIAVALAEERNTYFLLLVVSQFTDFLDGYLARKLRATSALGAKLDILGDACNYLVGGVGLFVFFPELTHGLRLIFLALFTVTYISRFVLAKIRTGEWVFAIPLVSAKVNFYVQSALVLALYFNSPGIHIFFYLAFVAGMTESLQYLQRLWKRGRMRLAAQSM